MKKIFILITILLTSTNWCQAKHLYTEKEYQTVWCNSHGGILEYKLDDGTRVDCLTETKAIEFDFAPKWAECIGQSLYYAQKTRKTPVCGLIMENPIKDIYYLKRLRYVGYKKGIKTFTLKPEYLAPKQLR